MQVGCSPPLEKFSCKKFQRGDQGKNLPPLNFFKKLKRKPQRGDQRIFWLESRKTLKGGLKKFFWTKFRNVSQKCFLWSLPLWDFYRISVKIFKKLWFLLKKNFKLNFGDFAKNCPLNPMSLPSPLEIRVSPSLERGTLRNPACKNIHNLIRDKTFPLTQTKHLSADKKQVEAFNQ